MPEQISVTEFIAETNEDYKAPTTSNFTTRMSHCRNTVAALEEVRSTQTAGGEVRGGVQPEPCSTLNCISAD